MFDFIIQPMMTLGSMIMQTSTGTPEGDSIVSIIISIAAIAGTIGTILKLFPKTKHVGQMLDAGYQKVAEDQELLYRGFQALDALVPELGPQLKKYGVPLTLLEKRSKITAEQLEFFRDLALSKSKEQAASVKDLPRESETVTLRRA